jgi:two-component system, cell cycle sensor histidine kinase and response regulator CckA
MPWMIPAVVATLFDTLVLVFVYFYLFNQYRERSVGLWTLSWTLYTLRLLFELWTLLSGESACRMIGNQTASLLSGLLLLGGAYAFQEKTLPRWWIYGSAAGVLWIVGAVLSGVSFTLLTLPTFLLLGAIYVLTGSAFLGMRRVRGMGRTITGWAFILWGIHKVNYPFLRPVEWLAPWGYIVAAVLGLVVAVGMLLVYHQKTLQDLSESEERYRSLFANNHAVMLLIDPDTGGIVDANPAACAFYGYTREGLLSVKITDINTLSPEQVFQEMERSRLERRHLFHFRHRLANGEMRDVEVYSGPINVEGKTLLYSIVHDIAARRQAEEKLRTATSQLAVLIEHMRDGILFEDGSRRIALANRAFCSLFYIAAPPEALAGADSRAAAQKASLLFPEPRQFVARIDEMIDSGNIVTNEALLLADGRTFERDYIPIVMRGSGLGHLWQYRDITERRRLESQLRHAQKMDAIGQLAGGVAHDFNNVLTAIIGYGSLLLLKMKGDDPLRTHVDQILASSERAAGLTQGLLSFSRKKDLTLRPVSLSEIAIRVEKLLHRLIGEDIELKTIVPVQDMRVMGDSGQIEQVLINLATNARDAMPGGGVLTIELDRTKLDIDFKKTYGYGKPGAYALLSVMDTGKGMDEETRERIFEPFFTTKEPGKGTGLGLSIVYGIVKQHNGYINVASTPGSGTTFSIYLPLTTADAARPEHSSALPSDRGTETILLAEDDAEVRSLAKSVLEEFGYTVIESVDGEEAVKKFKQNRDSVHLLVLDVIMPKMSGKEAYEAIRAVHPGIKVLFTSGYAPDVVRKKGVLEQGTNFIMKPLSPLELLKKVRAALG